MSRCEIKKENYSHKNYSDQSRIKSVSCAAKQSGPQGAVFSPYRLSGRTATTRGRGRGRDIAYLRWRKSLNLPEESTDFSDRDAFDVAEFLIDTYCQADDPVHVVVARQRQANPEATQESKPEHEPSRTSKRRMQKTVDDPAHPIMQTNQTPTLGGDDGMPHAA